MAGVVCPAITGGVNLPPFVEDLGHSEDGSHASKGLPYLSKGSCSKIADHYSRAMYEWKLAVIEVIPVTGNKDAAKSKGFRSVVRIWMTPGTICLHCQHISFKTFENAKGQCREVLVGIKSWFRLSTGELLNSSFFSFTGFVSANKILHIDPGHIKPYHTDPEEVMIS